MKKRVEKKWGLFGVFFVVGGGGEVVSRWGFECIDAHLCTKDFYVHLREREGKEFNFCPLIFACTWGSLVDLVWVSLLLHVLVQYLFMSVSCFRLIQKGLLY